METETLRYVAGVNTVEKGDGKDDSKSLTQQRGLVTTEQAAKGSRPLEERVPQAGVDPPSVVPFCTSQHRFVPTSL